jgi:hypothetical protein
MIILTIKNMDVSQQYVHCVTSWFSPNVNIDVQQKQGVHKIYDIGFEVSIGEAFSCRRTELVNEITNDKIYIAWWSEGATGSHQYHSTVISILSLAPRIRNVIISTVLVVHGSCEVILSGQISMISLQMKMEFTGDKGD